MSKAKWTTALVTVGLIIVVFLAGAGTYTYSGSYNVAATDDLEGSARYVFGTTAETSTRVPPGAGDG